MQTEHVIHEDISTKSVIESPKEEEHVDEFKGNDTIDELKGEEKLTSEDNLPNSSKRFRKPKAFPDFVTFHMKAKQGLAMYKEAAIKALTLEIINTIDYDVWVPMKLKDIPRHMKILPSFAFLKEKYTAEGKFKELKARLVGGGHLQDRSIYKENETSSPTPDTTHLFILFLLGGKPGFHVVSGDVKAAYLNAPIMKEVFIRLDPIVSSILVNVDEPYLPYLGIDQTIVVKLKKALYGCIESARLWHEHLSKSLLSIPDIKQSRLDPCIFYSNDKNIQTFICTYVDDILIISNNDKFTSTIQETLSKTYEMKYSTGSRLLGDEFDI